METHRLQAQHSQTFQSQHLLPLGTIDPLENLLMKRDSPASIQTNRTD